MLAITANLYYQGLHTELKILKLVSWRFNIPVGHFLFSNVGEGAPLFTLVKGRMRLKVSESTL